jgi:hypothetical protein
MTPEQCARFVLSDGQDHRLRELVLCELDARVEKEMLDPAVRAQWRDVVKEFADRIDQYIFEQVMTK